ncbi:uncharacterized protein B0P05DRAFT_464870 [Gilbertella persicaria]|uniref:uncharacterized protein n=1 Tax=Gilbertella persicaria TaxID=101096 RepID=UPI0022205AF2|nr:uncharacterized protein B0P05DRAFT_464870 [Gilbertella persicaria]KAI8087879.1 hypothetical protein B0P05DRAFT_464870 [Gilbertella persicaria]
MKTAIQFLKDDPLFLLNHLSLIHTRSTSLDVQQSTEPVTPSCHRKTQSADLYSTVEPSDTHRRNSAILRPHIVLPNPRHHDHRKSLEIPHDWLLPTHTMEEKQQQIPSRHLAASKPMIQTTFPKISNSTPLSAEPSVPKLGRSLSASTVVKKKASQPPTIINLRDRVSFDGIQRPASISLDTRSLHSIEDSAEDQEELMGDFLMGLSKLDGDVVGARSGSFKTFRRL